MTWQKVVRHVSDQRLIVESKSGNQYPAATEYDRLGETIYSQMMNEKRDHVMWWAWVDFDGDGPEIQDLSTGDPDGGPPDSPPWDR